MDSKCQIVIVPLLQVYWSTSNCDDGTRSPPQHDKAQQQWRWWTDSEPRILDPAAGICLIGQPHWRTSQPM